MKVNLYNAVKYFFPNPSLEMVYFEAIANAIDAESTIIEVTIKLDSLSKTETFSIEIKDNGSGFNENNFSKFSKLLEIEKRDHKGLGRLVFLNYFKNVNFHSYFSSKQRIFELTDNFDGENEILDAQSPQSGTTIIFKDYRKEKIKTYDFVKPDNIKKQLIRHFFPLFHSLKIHNKDLRILIKLETKEPNIPFGFYSDTQEIVVKDIPALNQLNFDAEGVDLFEKFILYYSVKEVEAPSDSITALCVDNRTINVDIISKGGLPFGYEIIFLLYSDLFEGRANSSRQELNMEEAELKAIKKLFAEKIAQILNEEVPRIQEANKIVTKNLNQRYPHLMGYFDDQSVGLIDRNIALENAQSKFFSAQREVLESTSLSEEQYEKSLEISSRILTEYILYRNIVIERLKKINHNSSEADIHNIIIPMRSTLKKDNFHNDLFTNNAWLLDDKYMSYSTILSDEEMKKVLNSISDSNEDLDEDDSRPDIAIVFSDDPNKNAKVDVIIVELKKLNLKLERKNDVVVQLTRRATKLLKVFPDKIQRIWFYGILDIDKEFRLFLKGDGFAELYSNDNVLYKPQEIYLDDDIKVPIGIYIQSFRAFIEDAENRNSTFLNILKEGLKARFGDKE